MINKYFCVAKLKRNQYYNTTNFRKLVLGLNNVIPLTPFQICKYMHQMFENFFCLMHYLYILFFSVCLLCF